MTSAQVKPYWIKAYTAANPLEAELLVGMLRHHGINSGLRSRSLIGGIGELPADALHTPVWVSPEDVGQARQILKEYEQKNDKPQWQCTECGELNEANFELCWQCGTELQTPSE